MRLLHKNNKIPFRTVTVNSLKYDSKSSIFPFILQVLLLCTTLVGFLYCVSTSVDMTVNFGTICLISVPIMIVSVFLSLNKKVYLTFLAVFATFIVLLSFYAKNLISKIIDSFVFCYNLTVHIMVEQGYINYESSMTTDISQFLANESYMTESFYTVIIVLSVLFSLLFSATLVKRSLIWVSFLPCFLVLTPSLYFGSTPSTIAFSIFISGVLGCYVESISKLNFKNKSDKSKNTKSNGKLFSSSINGFSCMCVSLVLSLSVSVALFSSEGFQIDSIRKIIDKIAQDVMNVLFYENYESADGAVGGLLNGDVLELKTPEFRDLPVMTVTSKTNSALYLRGWIGDDLLEKGWKILDEQDTAEYIEQVGSDFDETSQFYNYTKIISDELSNKNVEEIDSDDTKKLGFIYDEINVKTKYTKSLMIFTPVRCVDGEINTKGASVITTGDTVTFFSKKNSKNKQYSYKAALQTFSDRDFYLSINSNLEKYLSNSNNSKDIADFISNERKYTQYVKQKYMTIPENADMLMSLAEQITQNYSQDFAKALAVEKYFKTNYSYEQNFASAAGSAIQKVNYMISETKTGYCTYFATAMTVMMRQLGIPARFVTGYHTKTLSNNSNKYVRNVEDNDYHAWVEVYFEGMGWLTFDPTPGESTNEQLRDYDYLDDPVPQSDEPSDEPLPEAPDQNEEPSPPPPPPPEIIEEEVPLEINIDIPLWVIIGALALLFLIVVAVLIYVIVLLINIRFNNYIRSLQKTPSTKLVCELYPKLLYLLSALGYSLISGEMINDFASRVDKALKLPVSMLSIVSTLEMSQFSENKIDINDAARVFDVYTLIYTTAFNRFNVFKKYYYMIKISKKNKL